MPSTRLAIPVPKSQGRTRQGNGVAIFPPGTADGRSGGAKRFKEILAELLADIGGRPSERQLQLARRAATLSILAENLEAQLATGIAIDPVEFSTITNTLQRLLSDLRPVRGEYDRAEAAGVLASAMAISRSLRKKST